MIPSNRVLALRVLSFLDCTPKSILFKLSAEVKIFEGRPWQRLRSQGLESYVQHRTLEKEIYIVPGQKIFSERKLLLKSHRIWKVLNQTESLQTSRILIRVGTFYNRGHVIWFKSIRCTLATVTRPKSDTREFMRKEEQIRHPFTIHSQFDLQKRKVQNKWQCPVVSFHWSNIILEMMSGNPWMGAFCTGSVFVEITFVRCVDNQWTRHIQKSERFVMKSWTWCGSLTLCLDVIFF